MSKLEYTPDSELDLDGVIEKYYDAVRSNALYATRSETAASDVTQSVFVLLVERWNSLERDRIGGWIFAVLRRKLLEYFKERSKAESIRPLDDADLPDAALFSEDRYFEIGEEELESAKERVLSVLSEKERALYELYFTEHRSYEDICSIYSIGYNAAALRIKRIRRKLEKTIKGNGNDLLPTLAAAVSMQIVTYLIFNGRWGK